MIEIYKIHMLSHFNSLGSFNVNYFYFLKSIYNMNSIIEYCIKMYLIFLNYILVHLNVQGNLFKLLWTSLPD